MLSLGPLVSSGSQNDKHLVPFHPRPCLYLAHIHQIVFQLLQNARTQLTVGHLAAPKPDCSFHLIAALEPLARVLHAIVIVVIVRAGTKLHFLDRYRYLFLLRLVSFLLGFVLKFSEVNDSANGRIGCSSNLHEVETFFPGGANGISNIQHAELLTLLANHSHLRNANSFINAGNRQAPVIRTRAATSKACSYASPPKVNVLGFEFRVSS